MPGLPLVFIEPAFHIEAGSEHMACYDFAHIVSLKDGMAEVHAAENARLIHFSYQVAESPIIMRCGRDTARGLVVNVISLKERTKGNGKSFGAAG